jgi:hypothetical protein
VRRDALKEEKREAMKGREALLVRRGGKREKREGKKEGNFSIGTLLQAVGPYIAPDRSEKWLFSWWMVNFMLYRMVDGGSRSILSPRSEAKSGNPAESCPL